MTSTPIGYHRSPCLRSNSTVLFANVLKYSPSSTCVPSHSKTSRTDSEAETPSLSLPTTKQIYVIQMRHELCYRCTTGVLIDKHA